MHGRDFIRLLVVLLLGVLIGLSLARYAAWNQPAPVIATTKTIIPETPSDEADDNEDVEEISNEPTFDAEAVMYDQPRLMDAAISALKPQTPGKTDLYFVAFGGDGSEDVFRNEAEYAERLFAQRFDAAGHTLALVNNPATVGTRPLATRTNLETAFDALAKTMDVDDDVLVLFLTSHGSADHELLVALDPLPLDQIDADDLAEMLAEQPFRWRAVIVSACYSGGFVAPLKNATTLVVTAARADRTSFGCGADADITWFGKAFLAEGLNQNDSFAGAFGIAKSLIEEWETRDGEEHSEPQFISTPLIDAKLKAWRNGIRLGPPLRFVAPPRPRAALSAPAPETTTAQR